MFNKQLKGTPNEYDTHVCNTFIGYKEKGEMSNDTYAPWLPMSKGGFDRKVFKRYKEPVINRFIFKKCDD